MLSGTVEVRAVQGRLIDETANRIFHRREPRQLLCVRIYKSVGNCIYKNPTRRFLRRTRFQFNGIPRLKFVGFKNPIFFFYMYFSCFFFLSIIQLYSFNKTNYWQFLFTDYWNQWFIISKFVYINCLVVPIRVEYNC